MRCAVPFTTCLSHFVLRNENSLLKMYGLLLRLGDNRWSKCILTCSPEGRKVILIWWCSLHRFGESESFHVQIQVTAWLCQLIALCLVFFPINEIRWIYVRDFPKLRSYSMSGWLIDREDWIWGKWPSVISMGHPCVINCLKRTICLEFRKVT